MDISDFCLSEASQLLQAGRGRTDGLDAHIRATSRHLGQLVLDIHLRRRAMC